VGRALRQFFESDSKTAQNWKIMRWEKDANSNDYKGTSVTVTDHMGDIDPLLIGYRDNGGLPFAVFDAADALLVLEPIYKPNSEYRKAVRESTKIKEGEKSAKERRKRYPPQDWGLVRGETEKKSDWSLGTWFN